MYNNWPSTCPEDGGVYLQTWTCPNAHDTNLVTATMYDMSGDDMQGVVACTDAYGQRTLANSNNLQVNPQQVSGCVQNVFYNALLPLK